jgi:cytochrome b561
MRAIGQKTGGWSLGLRLLHWLTVVVLATQLVIGFFLFGPGMATHHWMPFHISIGASVLGIVLFRLAWRLFESRPLRTDSPALRHFSTAVHVALYVLIIAVVLTGWLAYRPAPLMPPARLFGFLVVPRAPDVLGLSARNFASAHSALVWAFLVFVAAHVAAALVHAVYFRDAVVRGMLFGRSQA